MVGVDVGGTQATVQTHVLGGYRSPVTANY